MNTEDPNDQEEEVIDEPYVQVVSTEEFVEAVEEATGNDEA